MTIDFSSPTGVSHSSDYHMWKKNDYASNGVRDFAEKGEAWALMKEIEAAGEKIQSVHGIFSAPSISSGTGQSSTELETHSRHPYVSTSCKTTTSSMLWRTQNMNLEPYFQSLPMAV